MGTSALNYICESVRRLRCSVRDTKTATISALALGVRPIVLQYSPQAAGLRVAGHNRLAAGSEGWISATFLSGAEPPSKRINILYCSTHSND